MKFPKVDYWVQLRWKRGQPMIGSLEIVPLTRPHQTCTRCFSGSLLKRNFRRSVCFLAAADHSAVPFPRLNATELQGQPLAQDVQKFGRRPFEGSRFGFVDDTETIKTKAKAKGNTTHDSSLTPDEPLPLPMTYPVSKPASKEQIDAMLNCDALKEDCKQVVYQWTGECRACRGTGSVSFYRKKHEVISTCINCLGIGHVNKITARADVEDMDGTKENERKTKYSK